MSSPPWFRFYSETIHDRRLNHIAMETEQPISLIIGIWAVLLSLANDPPIYGNLLICKGIAFTWEHIAHILQIEEGSMLQIIEEFIDLKMLTINKEEVIAIAPDEWEKHKKPDLRGKWGKLRRRILERDNYICGYCHGWASHVDHIIPRSKGGSDNPGNLIAACQSCNLRKGGRTPGEAGMELKNV